MAAPYVQLPGYQANALINFEPVGNALSQVTQQNNHNALMGLQQRAADRADQSLDLDKQRTAADLKSQAAQYEDLTHRILASTAQGALSVQDPSARAAIANGIISGHPEMTANLTKYGVDPKNPDAVLNFFGNYGQNPLDRQLKQAQIGQAQTSTAIARAPSPVVVGKDLMGDRFAMRDPVTGALTAIDPNVGGTSAGNEAVTKIGDAIIAGKQPPVLTGMGNSKIGPAVKAYLAGKNFDFTKANLEYDAAHKQVLSLNGPQMVRYSGLSTSVINTIDRVNELATQMNNSGITGLNAAKIATLINTAGNTDQGKLASQYLAAVNTLKEEFANLAQGGYAPTEAAWDLAKSQINSNYGVDQLGASLGEVQRLLRYRLNGIPNMTELGPGASNRYVNGGQAPDMGHGGQTQPGAAPQGGAPSAAAGQQAPVRVNTPDDAMKLPSGTTFITPDGRIKVKP